MKHTIIPIYKNEKVCYLPMSLGCQKTLELVDSTFASFFETPCGIRSLKELVACQGSLIQTHEVKKLYALIMGEQTSFPDHEIKCLLSYIRRMEEDLRENLQYIKCDE
ncbi:MAG: hypothetical protein WC774_02340 [Candidatus Gracilibacteria bacterium]